MERRKRKEQDHETTIKAYADRRPGCDANLPLARWPTKLTGAGGTAIYPVLPVWAENYKQQDGDQINYQSIGSGGGIKQIEAKTVDFGAIRQAAEARDLAKNNLVQFPQVIISIVPVVHLPGIQPGQLVLDGERSPTSISARSPSGTIRRSR